MTQLGHDPPPRVRDATLSWRCSVGSHRHPPGGWGSADPADWHRFSSRLGRAVCRVSGVAPMWLGPAPGSGEGGRGEKRKRGGTVARDGGSQGERRAVGWKAEMPRRVLIPPAWPDVTTAWCQASLGYRRIPLQVV